MRTKLIVATTSALTASAMAAGLAVAALLVGAESPRIHFPSGCSLFPANNIWNTRVNALPLDRSSAAYVRSMGETLPLHGDFGPADGIPFNVANNPPRADITFSSGNDPGPYYFPTNTTLEGSDAHAIVLDPRNCRLYETFLTKYLGPGRWQADTGAVYDLRSNRLRVGGFSIDAAGLPILPGLLRYQEVAEGRIPHALRFTTKQTRRTMVWPATHFASLSNDPNFPPMGQRFRLRRSLDIRSFSKEARVILGALQEYGMMLADNGGTWFITGTPDSRWPRGLVAELRRVKGADFEAVDVTSLMSDPSSGEAISRPDR